MGILSCAQTQEVHCEQIITNNKHRHDFKLHRALQRKQNITLKLGSSKPDSSISSKRFPFMPVLAIEKASLHVCLNANISHLIFI